MFATTTMITLQIPYVKHKPWILAVAWLLFFGFLDGLFFGAALQKVPHGAWIPLLIGTVLCVIVPCGGYGQLILDMQCSARAS